MKVVLAATDGSEQAQRAVEMAAKIAEKFGSELVIISTLQFDELSPGEIGLAESELRDQLNEELENAKPEIAANGGISLGLQLSQQAALARSVHKLLGERLLYNAKASANANGAKQVRTVLLEGDPATEVVQAADSCGADLIVVGRRGRGRTASMLLGSVSAKVIERTKRPVMTVA